MEQNLDYSAHAAWRLVVSVQKQVADLRCPRRRTTARLQLDYSSSAAPLVIGIRIRPSNTSPDISTIRLDTHTQRCNQGLFYKHVCFF